MAETLTCTADEKTAFLALSDALKEGWTVEDETLTYSDTPERRAFRLNLMHVHDPELVRFRSQVQSTTSTEQFLALVKTIDFKNVDRHDLVHGVFALGPEGMGAIIAELLATAESKDDIELIAAFTTLRHGMLESFHRHS